MNDLILSPEVPADISTIATAEGLKPFIDYALNVARESAKEVNDANTDKGRKAIGSLANKVSSSKTAIAKPAAAYVKGLKKQGEDAQKLFKKYSDEMDKIRDDIKRPADEWKKTEKARIDGLNAELLTLDNLIFKADPETGEVFTAEDLTAARNGFSVMTFCPEKWGDMHEEVMTKWSDNLAIQDANIKDRAEYERVLAESEKLKADLAEKNKQAEIDNAAHNATLKANQDAANAIAIANAKADSAIETARLEAEAAQKVKDDAQAVLDDIEAKRIANIDHQAEVNNRTMNELMQCCEGLTDKQAKKLITNFVNKKFTHITINY